MGLREQLLSEWLSNSASTYRSHNLEQCLKKGLGCSLPGNFHQGPLECARGEAAHQCLGATSSNIGSESTSAIPRTSTSAAQTYSLENSQHHSGGVHQQERGHALPFSDCTSLRVVGRSITDSSANVVADRASRQIETRTEWTLDRKIFQSICQRFYTQVDLFVSQVCLKVPRSRGSGCGCIPPGLEQMDLSNPSSHSPSTSGTEEDQRGSSNCSPPNRPELDRTAMVSRPNSDAGGSPTAATPAPISIVSPMSANSIPSPVKVPSSNSLAAIRDRYQATGLSKEVVDIL